VYSVFLKMRSCYQFSSMRYILGGVLNTSGASPQKVVLTYFVSKKKGIKDLDAHLLF
jgi:hypothetical protein